MQVDHNDQEEPKSYKPKTAMLRRHNRSELTTPCDFITNAGGG